MKNTLKSVIRICIRHSKLLLFVWVTFLKNPVNSKSEDLVEKMGLGESKMHKRW